MVLAAWVINSVIVPPTSANASTNIAGTNDRDATKRPIKRLRDDFLEMDFLFFVGTGKRLFKLTFIIYLRMFYATARNYLPFYV